MDTWLIAPWENLALYRWPPGDTHMWATNCHHGWPAPCWNGSEGGAVVAYWLFWAPHARARAPTPACPWLRLLLHPQVTLLLLLNTWQQPFSTTHVGMWHVLLCQSPENEKMSPISKFLNTWVKQSDKRNILEHQQFFRTQTNKNFCFPLSSLF